MGHGQDADKELLWAKIQKTRKPVGLVMMDQSMIAGVGNIYRAEILFKVNGSVTPLGCCKLAGRNSWQI